jgi:hypothetical protein
MSTFEDPNRESVGLPPIWTGAGEEPPPDPPVGEVFDPSEHTVAEVNEYLDANPDDEDRVIEAERAGKARKALIGDDDE